MFQKIEITDKEIVDFVISYEQNQICRRKTITDHDLERLRTLPMNECSEVTRQILRTFLMKYAEYHEKNFEKEIDELIKFESDPQYRDHSCHLFRVWGLGRIFYKYFFNPFFKSIKIDINDHDEHMFNFVWCLCAIYHDIGYPNQNDLKNKKGITRNHGEIGATQLKDALNKKFSGKWDQQANFAINAIYIHDREDFIDINIDPYSALLIICDELQEWGRNKTDSKNRPEISKLIVWFSQKNMSDSIDVELSYSKKVNKEISDLISEIGKKESELNEQFSHRIQGIKVKVKCVMVE